MHKYILTTIILICLLPTWAFAAPSITGAVFSNQSTVTITGSAFGAKTQAPPWLFDNFDTGATNGVSILNRTSPIGGRTWKYYNMGGSGGPTNYDSSQSHSGSFSASEYAPVGGSNNAYVSGQAMQIRYMSYWYKFNPAPTGSAVWKFDRTTSGLSQGVANPPYNACPTFGWGNSAGGYTIDCTNTINQWLGWPSVGSANSWHNVETYFTMSDKGVANGTMQIWIDGVLYTNQVGNLLTCFDDATTCQIDSWIMPLMANDTSSLTTWVDDVYIDNTAARVMIGDQNTFAASTHREIQPARTWADGSIHLTYNPGSFTDGQDVWLYVLDSTGTPSAGYHITVGGAQSDTTKPVTSSNKPAGRYTATQTVTLTCSDDVACASSKYCFGSGCTPTTTYSAPFKVLQNLAAQTYCVSSTDTSNNAEVAKCFDLKKQKKKR